MLEYARWKYVAILFVVLVSALYALPNIYPQDPSVQVTANNASKADAALEKRVEQALAAAKLTPKSVAIEDGKVMARFDDVEVQAKAADAVGTALGSDYTVALNLATTMPEWLGWFKAKPMQLGLDLQGGVHFLMEIDRTAAIDKRMNALLDGIRADLREAGIRYESVERVGQNRIVATLLPGANVAKAAEVVQTDISGAFSTGGVPAFNAFQMDTVGNEVRVNIAEATLDQMASNAIEQNISTLRNRVNELGVAEPVIQRQGAERIVVQLPGVQDTAKAKRVLGATATLEYRGVYGSGSAAEAQAAIDSGIVPPDAKVFFEKGSNSPLLLDKRVIASGEQLQTASAFFDPESSSPAVRVTLTDAGGRRMFEHSSMNIGKPMAVVYIETVPEVKIVDGKEVRTSRVKEEVINTAIIRSALSDTFQTTGLGNMDEASQLALLLRAGALAAPMQFAEERVIGPSLGKENIERGVQAILYSFGFVLLFFVVYYRMFGLITNLAVVLNLLMVLAVMSILGATLSLPGLAGIALTVGMSVDANVLINERIREELRAGMPPQAAIANGYDRAAGTIADANVTALLAGVALWAFGTGPIQGFAISLIVGIVTSMYTAVSVSRGVATLIYGRRKLKSIAI